MPKPLNTIRQLVVRPRRLDGLARAAAQLSGGVIDQELIAYSVKNREGHKDFWVRIGATWPHEGGSGLSLYSTRGRSSQPV